MMLDATKIFMNFGNYSGSKRRAEKRSAFRHLWLHCHRAHRHSRHLLLHPKHERACSTTSKMSIHCRNARKRTIRYGRTPLKMAEGASLFRPTLAGRGRDGRSASYQSAIRDLPGVMLCKTSCYRRLHGGQFFATEPNWVLSHMIFARVKLLKSLIPPGLRRS